LRVKCGTVCSAVQNFSNGFHLGEQRIKKTWLDSVTQYISKCLVEYTIRCFNKECYSRVHWLYGCCPNEALLCGLCDSHTDDHDECVFMYSTPCSLIEFYRYSRRTYNLHLQSSVSHSNCLRSSLFLKLQYCVYSSRENKETCHMDNVIITVEVKVCK
jgi:hypothetical protein